MMQYATNLFDEDAKTGAGILAVKGEVDIRHGPILYLEDVSVSFDGFKALNSLSLYIDTGSVFFGQTIDLLQMDELAIAQAGICRKFQKPSVFDALTVFENLELALKADKRTWPTLFFRLSGEQRDRIDYIMETVGLSAFHQARAGILSHGQKQWLEIGMLLMQEPKVMLVDEPIAGMTHQEIERTAELLLSLQGQRSIVVVEHDMEFVRSIARKVTVLHEGSVLTEGTMDEVQNDPRVIQVYLGG